MKMETLLQILKDLHPDVDFETCDTLVDSGILDSFDIITLIAEISSEFDVNIPRKRLYPTILIRPRRYMP